MSPIEQTLRAETTFIPGVFSQTKISQTFHSETGSISQESLQKIFSDDETRSLRQITDQFDSRDDTV